MNVKQENLDEGNQSLLYQEENKGEENILTQEAAQAQSILHSQQEAEDTMEYKILSHAVSFRRSIRRSFSDQDKYLLFGIMSNLIAAINVSVDSPSNRNLYTAIFTIFPILYCQRRRGGAAENQQYTHFLRKRYSELNFHLHAERFLFGATNKKPETSNRPNDTRSVKESF